MRTKKAISASHQKIINNFLKKLRVNNNRSPKRVFTICDLLRKAWQKHSEMRLGQFIYYLIDSNLTKDFKNSDRTDIYYIEDDYLLTALNRFLKKKGNMYE